MTPSDVSAISSTCSDGNPDAPVCTSCHEKHDIRKPSERDSAVHATNISEVCNACHPGHSESLHRQEGTDPALISCASCHTGHQTDMASINHLSLIHI